MVDLVWYFTDLPFQTTESIINSLDWDEEPWRPRLVGEQFGHSRNYNGREHVDGLLGGHECGPPVDFIEGQPWPYTGPPVEYDQDNIPKCCPRAHVGNVGAGAQANDIRGHPYVAHATAGAQPGAVLPVDRHATAGAQPGATAPYQTHATAGAQAEAGRPADRHATTGAQPGATGPYVTHATAGAQAGAVDPVERLATAGAQANASYEGGPNTCPTAYFLGLNNLLPFEVHPGTWWYYVGVLTAGVKYTIHRMLNEPQSLSPTVFYGPDCEHLTEIPLTFPCTYQGEWIQPVTARVVLTFHSDHSYTQPETFKVEEGPAQCP